MLLNITNKITTNLLNETNLSKELDLESIKEKIIIFLTELKKEYHVKKIVWNVNRKGFRFGNYVAYRLKDSFVYTTEYYRNDFIISMILKRISRKKLVLLIDEIITEVNKQTTLYCLIWTLQYYNISYNIELNTLYVDKLEFYVYLEHIKHKIDTNTFRLIKSMELLKDNNIL